MPTISYISFPVVARDGVVTYQRVPIQNMSCMTATCPSDGKDYKSDPSLNVGVGIGTDIATKLALAKLE